ncbi:MAG TPA: hypothetical protein VGM88_21710 [Kofleriaceae bacterium]
MFDPERRRALLGTPPRGAAVSAPGAATQGESWELVTEVTPRPVATVPVEQATPTRIDTPVPVPPAGAVEQATPTELTARPERSEPLRVISMKDQAEGGTRAPAEPRVPLHVRLRAMAEVAGVHEAAGLGRLAPPHDPRQARRRRQRANLAWAGVAAALAAGISIAIWLIAGR